MNRPVYSVHTALVCWDLDTSDRIAASAAFQAAGFPAPKQRTEYELLKSAMADNKAKDQLVQRLKHHKRCGAELVDVERGEEENSYSSTYSARVEKGQVIVPRGNGNSQALQQRYDHHASQLTPGPISAALVDALDRLHAVRARGKGGVYWLHVQHLATWEQLSTALEAASLNGGTRMHVHTVELSPRTTRDITEAVKSEVMERATQITNDLAKQLDAEGVAKRQQKAVELAELVATYKEILAESASAIEEVVQLVQTQAAIAAMQKMAAASA